MDPASSVIRSFVLVKKPLFATDVNSGSTVPVKWASVSVTIVEQSVPGN